MIFSEHKPLGCVGTGDGGRGLGGSHTAWTRTASHISLSLSLPLSLLVMGVLRLVHNLSLLTSTLSLNILPNIREHWPLYKIPPETESLGACTIPIAPWIYSKERYRLLQNRQISWRSPPWHAFLRRIYNRTTDWVKECDVGTSDRGQDGTSHGDWGRGGIPLPLSPK